MADMLPEIENAAADLARLIEEHKGGDVSILDLRGINNWTDFFIVATASSKTHMDGLERHIKDHCRASDIDILKFSRKNTDDEWRLIDLGFIVIHIMSGQTREFYDLERLWRPIARGADE